MIGTAVGALVLSLAAVSAALPRAAPAGRGSPAAPPPLCTQTGTGGPDVLVGTPAADVLCGLAGNDVLLGRGGNDTLLGDGGDDTLTGGTADDTLRGGGGNDRPFGQSGDDILSGGPGDDLLVDRVGRNSLDGGPGRDVCVVGSNTTAVNCEVVVGRHPTGAPPRAANTASSSAVPGPPQFVPSESTAEVRGDDVVVSFKENGLAPGAATQVEVTVTRQLTITCTASGSSDVVLSSTSRANASDSSSYTADANGEVAGTRTLTASPGSVDVSGAGLTCQRTTTVTVVLHDLSNGATLGLTAS